MKIKQPLTRDAAIRRMVLIVVGALFSAILGMWLFTLDRPRLNLENRLREQRAEFDAKFKETEQRVETIAVQIPPEQEKVVQSEKTIRQLEELQGTWDRLVGNRAQQRANAERIASLRKLNAASIARVAELQQQLARARWERDNHEIERTRIDSQLRAEDSRKADALHRIQRGWISIRAWLCFGVSLYLLGPVLVPIAVEQWRRKKRGVTVGGEAE